MAKIDRFDGNLEAFASAALGTERTIFGEVTQSDDLTDQFSADLLRGWAIVGPSDQPTLQDFNGAMFTHGQLLAYLHQVGVPEYNATQEYHIGSLANVAGVVYSSLINTNVGNNPPSSPAQWSELYAQATEALRGTVELATSAETITGTDNTRAVHPAGLASLTSTTERKGLIETATDAETIAGTDTERAVPPSANLAEQKAHPAFSANRNNVNQTAIASGVATKIILTTEDFDNQAAFDTTLSRYTPLMAGIYQVNFASRLNTATDQSSFTVFIYKNGTQFKSATLIQSGAAGTQSAIVSQLVTMNGTTDYLEFFITQDTGTARDVLGATLQTFASAALVVRT